MSMTEKVEDHGSPPLRTVEKNTFGIIFVPNVMMFDKFIEFSWGRGGRNNTFSVF